MNIGNEIATCPTCGRELNEIVDDYQVFHCEECGSRFYYFHEVIWKVKLLNRK